MFNDRKQTTDHITRHDAFWLGFSAVLFVVIVGGVHLLRSFG